MVSTPAATAGADSQSILFSSFRLDLRGGQLVRAGMPIPLRPKTWAVLVYLAQRPGELVNRDELLDAVWPKVAVTPDTLTKSIGEIRLALGDDSQSPRFIETVHRRGFRFIGETDTGAAFDDGALAWRDRHQGAGPFVGRAEELHRLANAFAAAGAGERQLVFVTGPAGVGKTTLVRAFVESRAVQNASPPAWIAHGVCAEQHGPSEPYMPVLNALERLAGRADGTKLVSLLRRTAPTWLAQMPWLIGDDVGALRESVTAARPERMLREFAVLTEALTAEVPLVLVLEDLHWSDPSTVDLLSLIAERRDPARLLVIGTYRPAEVAVQEHALGHAVRTMHVRRRCIDLALHEFSDADVQAYLEQRFPGAQPPAELAPIIYAHTEGNPLFVAAAVEHMVSRGWVLETDPGWSFTSTMTAVDIGIPDDVRHMIAAQYETLAPVDRDLLAAASVAGREFAVPAIAEALRRPVEEVETGCERLVRSQRFLRFAGSSEWPDGTVALRYAFNHALYRRAIYDAISDGTRQRLHQRIGAALDAAYGDRAAEIAAELAAHFEHGGDYPRALRHLISAATNARQRLAGREAIGFLQTAIGLTRRLSDPGERDREELGLRLALAPLLNDFCGFASEELLRNCQRAYELCGAAGMPTERFQVVYALCHVYVVRGDPIRVPAVTAELIELADRLGTPEHQLLAHSTLLRSALHQARFSDVRRCAEGPLAPYLPNQLGQQAAGHGTDPVIDARCHYAWALWFLGYPERASTVMEASLAAARTAGVSPFTRASVLALGAELALLRRDAAGGRALADELVALSDEHGFPFYRAVAGALIGRSRVLQGELREGIEELERARVAHRATGARAYANRIAACLADAHLRAGERAAGLAVVDEGLQIAETTLDRSFWPELWRLKGDLLLLGTERGGSRSKTGKDSAESEWNEAESCFQRAIDLARESEAKSLELPAATSLARAWQARQRSMEARTLLEEICGWFGESATNLDLLEARALLEPRPKRRRSGST
jgi:DNA-binding winged helix-turn-helix (wHTH) protein